jgi:hypothetical protein
MGAAHRLGGACHDPRHAWISRLARWIKIKTPAGAASQYGWTTSNTTTLMGASGTIFVPKLQAEHRNLEHTETGLPSGNFHFTWYEDEEMVQLSVSLGATVV